ncbi:Hypothetical protein NocV09_14000010, partial [Nannochloropsis oceanica]
MRPQKPPGGPSATKQAAAVAVAAAVSAATIATAAGQADAKAAWAARDFSTARLSIEMLSRHREVEGSTLSFCHGETPRLLLFIRRPHGSIRSKEEFQRDWFRFAADLRVEARLYDEEGERDGARERGRHRRLVLIKGCVLSP